MSRTLVGKLAIVTGASRGIGAAIAENLASKGCNLVLNYTSNSSADITASLKSKLESEHGIKAIPAQAEMGSKSGAVALVDAAKSAFATDGKLQIDIIVNNAGVAANAHIADVTEEKFNDTYRVNVLGPLLLLQAAQPFLPSDRSGRVVNVSSVSSSTGFVGQSIYGGTKAALEAMTRTWARELAENATVNAINPGPVEGPMYASNSPEILDQIGSFIKHTPGMTPRPGVDSEEAVEDAKKFGGRLAHTSEIAGVVGMLCTPDAQWCTGQVVCANGGMLMLH
ncbi:L-xylulose reductase [Paramyrothecium foliicola]|nr:L-xylulose reductase [Paramyrothecium foliicola]